MSQTNLSGASEDSAFAKQRPGNSARIRQYILLILLALMLGALWYDRTISRPNVESAFDRVEELNAATNAKVGNDSFTNNHVQEALNRIPTRVFSQSGYRIEVFSWRAGLPIMTRDYFAVFADAPPYRFLKHYKFKLPMEELTGDAAFHAVPKIDPNASLDLGVPVSDQGSSESKSAEGKDEKASPPPAK